MWRAPPRGRDRDRGASCRGLVPVALRAPSTSPLQEGSTLLGIGSFYFALTLTTRRLTTRRLSQHRIDCRRRLRGTITVAGNLIPHPRKRCCLDTRLCLFLAPSPRPEIRGDYLRGDYHCHPIGTLQFREFQNSELQIFMAKFRGLVRAWHRSPELAVAAHPATLPDSPVFAQPPGSLSDPR